MKVLGGILLIVGTSIGAGILALPVITSESGFVSSSILLFACWLLMTFCAFIILEVNLWLPEGSNMVSMAYKTMGKYGAAVSWVVYLFLLYSLLCAYMAGGSDVLNALLKIMGLSTPSSLDAIIFTVLLGFIVYLGTRSIDYVNRGLMTVKLTTFFILVIFASTHVQTHRLVEGHAKYLYSTLMVMITSFGFATIVPSIRSYFNSDVKKLRMVVLIGSLIPLICYIAWDFVILGSLPLEGEHGLLYVLGSGHATSELMTSLNIVIHSQSITTLSRVFTSICVATSFLGVALCLSDFLADGLRLNKQGLANVKIYGLTFLPPLLIVTLYPKAFITALNYAGAFCIVLLGVLPIIMVWRGRYIQKITAEYRVFGGKVFLFGAGVLAILVTAVGLYQEIFA